MGIKTRNFANNILSGGTIDGTDFLSGTLPSSNITNDSAASVTSIPSISNVISPVAGDPPSPTLGDIWYNSSTNALKFQGFQASAWASGGNSSSPAVGGMVGFGAQNAAVLAGGIVPAPSPVLTSPLANVQEYDGSAWTSVNSMSQVRNTFGGAGPQTSGVVFGGRITGNPFTYTAATEEYDGTNWTSGGSLGSTRYYMGAAGTQTAALSFGGLTGPANTDTEEYNGTSWTAGGTLSTGHHAGRGSGTQTAGLAASAAPPAPKTVSQSYDGTSWTAVNPTNSNNAYRGVSSLGTQASSLLWGGEPFTGATEHYDGTSWSVDAATLSISRSSTGGGGTGTTGLAISGESPAGVPANQATEEYSAGINVIKTFTTD